MKPVIFLLLSIISLHLFAQSNPITGIIISLPPNPDANIANWKSGTSMLTISATAKAGTGGRIDPLLESSRILVMIKKSGGKVCGSYTSQTAPAAGFNSLNKVWSGTNAVSLLGQDCTLPPGEYELCVRFFGNGPAGPIPQSDEKCKLFTIRGTEQQVYQPPQSLMPPNETIFSEADAVKPVTFRWTPVIPKSTNVVTYRLKIWQLMQGQNRSQAVTVNTPVVSKDVEDFTQTAVQIIKHDPDQLDDEFVWNVQALSKDGKPVGSNNGTSELFMFKRQHKPIVITKKIILVLPVNDAPVMIEKLPTFLWKLEQGQVLQPGSVYKIKIVEIKGDQSPEQAFRGNKPFFEKDSLISSTFEYPSSAPLFMEEKKYAWMVEAKTEAGVKITESEINEFSFLIKAGEGTLTLSFPVNHAEIPVGQLPEFSWLSSAQDQSDASGNTYKIKIVEIKGDESPENALRTNKPFFEKDSISRLRVQYPSSAPAFKEGQKYAWEVQLINKSGPIEGSNQTSAPFMFSVGGETAVKIDSIKLTCTTTYGIYSYTVYLKNPLTVNVVLNGFWCRKPGDINLSQVYTIVSQAPPNGTQISANTQITVSGQVNLLSQPANTFVRFTLKTYKITDQVDNATVTDSLKIPDCSCNPCIGKTTIFGNAVAPTVISENDGSVAVTSTVTHTPAKVIKVSAEIVDVERLGEAGCLRCTKESKEFGNFTGGSLNNNGGTIINGAKGYGKQIQWQFNTATLVNNFNYSLQMLFPPLTEVSCCKDSIRVCTRWSFTDANCITCDTLICSVIVREYKKTSGPISPVADVAAQIQKMGEPFTNWYNQETDQLPNDFHAQVERWKRINPESGKKMSMEQLEENLKQVFFTIRNLRTTAADNVWNVISGNNINSQCGGGDFETGSLNTAEWSGGYGTISTTSNNPIIGSYTSGFSPSSVGLNLPILTFSNNHSIVSYGNDPMVGAGLKTTSSPSNQYSLRLGNSDTNSNSNFGSEMITKKFTVTGNGIIKFMYALVLNEPSNLHTNGNPSFWVKVYDASGAAILNKVYLEPSSTSPLGVIIASPSSFFQTGPNDYNYSKTRFREWTCAKIDLSQYVGQTVSVALITTDCYGGAHFGYAYIDDWCGNCAGSTSGAVDIQAITNSCIKPGLQVCVNYTLPKIGTTIGSGTIKLQFYQNGTPVSYSLTSPNLTTPTGNYCFNIDAAQLPCTGPTSGWDIVATGSFSITVGTVTTPITVTSPDPVGNYQGVKGGFNNDLTCCGTLADYCCTGFIKTVTTTVAIVGNSTAGYNAVKFTPTFHVGPKLIKQVRISVINFESSSSNKECLTCETNAARYGSMSVPQNFSGGGKDAIEGMVYPGTPIIATCLGCPPNWKILSSSEVTWGSSSSSGYNLMDNIGDQSTSFTILLPKKISLSCCDDTIKICIKYSFTDVDCKTCDTIICYKIVNRATITQPAASIRNAKGIKDNQMPDAGSNQHAGLLIRLDFAVRERSKKAFNCNEVIKSRIT